MKFLKSKKAFLAVCAIVAALCIPGLALAESAGDDDWPSSEPAGYNMDLPVAGFHKTLCQTTKQTEDAYVKNTCTYFTNSDKGWSWTWWVDNVATGKRVTTPQVIDSVGVYCSAYTDLPSIDDSLKARGSTNGLFSASMKVQGSVKFDATND